MKRSEGRFLTTHTGSLIRPPGIVELARQAAALESAERSAYEKALRGAVADIVRNQVEAGIDVVNDGEFGKLGWANYILERLTGFGLRPVEPGGAGLAIGASLARLATDNSTTDN